MATDSTVAGYLAPELLVPANDDGLEDLLQMAIVGITGLPGSLVRPRWQPEPPARPAFNVDWCAFGVPRSASDVNAYINLEDLALLGQEKVERDEWFECLHSFYGPNSAALCKRLRDGLEVSQNRDALRSVGISLTEVREAVVLPALLKEKWVRRVDVTVLYRRRTSSAYQVLTIQTGQLGLDNEHYVTPIFIQP